MSQLSKKHNQRSQDNNAGTDQTAAQFHTPLHKSSFLSLNPSY